MDKNASYTVSEINREIKSLIEESFPQVWVQGELSNLNRHGSGHIYFTLKDDRSELKAVMFQGNNRYLKFKPENGMQVLVQGRITIYETRGQYQMVVQQMEPAGIGTLFLAFEALKKQLSAEGLFDQDQKQRIPELPGTVGVITSPTGAAFQDIKQVLNRRAPHIRLVLRPTTVQGDQAAMDIAAALGEMGSMEGIDVLIIGRGGGSLEDLWPFNEERVARALAACPVPVISAVGHETDLTIADLVADHRAPTPSAAAEIVSPATADLLHQLTRDMLSLTGLVEIQLQTAGQNLDNLAGRYGFQQFQARISQAGQDLSVLRNHLYERTGFYLAIRSSTMEGFEKKIEALNPEQVLKRGYSIVFRLPDRTIVRSPKAISKGDDIEVLSAGGSYRAEKRSNVNPE